MADPHDWVPHHLLAETYLKQREFEKAREQAANAIQRNRVASSPAWLVLGEALANLGRNGEAIEALRTFLQQVPDSPLAPQVRGMIVQLARLPATPAKDTGAQVRPMAFLSGSDFGLEGLELRPSTMSWEPPGIDTSRPAVAAA